MLTRLKTALPPWMQDWLDLVVPAAQILLIIAVALVLHHLLRRLIFRASDHYQFPHELIKPINAIVRLLILGGATLLVLERLGVSASVLWSAFTGFAAVGAVAFFAAWSVLSNIFCAFLIFMVGPFRVGDHIELLDTNTEKPGPRGQVVDINLLYTTLQDTGSAPGEHSSLQIPNALIFQRVVRRWQTGQAPTPTLQPALTPQPTPGQLAAKAPSLPEKSP